MKSIVDESPIGVPEDGTAVRERTDPWVHRSTGMRCVSCMWFVEKAGIGAPMIGRCRRHAPTMNGYPVVFETDWCGDHKLDENRLVR